MLVYKARKIFSTFHLHHSVWIHILYGLDTHSFSFVKYQTRKGQTTNDIGLLITIERLFYFCKFGFYALISRRDILETLLRKVLSLHIFLWVRKFLKKEDVEENNVCTLNQDLFSNLKMFFWRLNFETQFKIGYFLSFIGPKKLFWIILGV